MLLILKYSAYMHVHIQVADKREMETHGKMRDAKYIESNGFHIGVAHVLSK